MGLSPSGVKWTGTFFGQQGAEERASPQAVNGYATETPVSVAFSV
jgi:hypothetical protein